MKKILSILMVVCLGLLTAKTTFAEGDVPKLLNFQGRVSVDGQPFTGTGQFKFALVNMAGTTTYWSNDDTSTSASEPLSGIAVFVSDGIYSVVLGGSGMSPINESVFANNNEVALRVWFNDGSHGFEMLSPDQRILSVGYAVRASVADTVKDSGRTIVTGSIDSRNPGDETIDVLAVSEWKYSYVNGSWQYILDERYTRYGVKNIPIADLDVNDMPIVNVYLSNAADADEWYSLSGNNYIAHNVTKIDPSYVDFRVLNNYIQLLYLHLDNRDNPNSSPTMSYVGASPSYNVFYKVIIMK